MYEDGTPGEVFIAMAKEGSTISGLMDTLATSISYGLQYGVPLKFFVDKFGHVRFEPSGWTGNQQVPYAKSIIDYIFRWLGARFLGITEANRGGRDDEASTDCGWSRSRRCHSMRVRGDAPLCSECGSMMTRNGSCYKCENCGGTSGCSSAARASEQSRIRDGDRPMSPFGFYGPLIDHLHPQTPSVEFRLVRQPFCQPSSHSVGCKGRNRRVKQIIGLSRQIQ